jgi:hypothetical protein
VADSGELNGLTNSGAELHRERIHGAMVERRDAGGKVCAR